jgi:hypothetical protein
MVAQCSASASASAVPVMTHSDVAPASACTIALCVCGGSTNQRLSYRMWPSALVSQSERLRKGPCRAARCCRFRRRPACTDRRSVAGPMASAALLLPALEQASRAADATGSVGQRHLTGAARRNAQCRARSSCTWLHMWRVMISNITCSALSRCTHEGHHPALSAHRQQP